MECGAVTLRSQVIGEHPCHVDASRATALFWRACRRFVVQSDFRRCLVQLFRTRKVSYHQAEDSLPLLNSQSTFV